MPELPEVESIAARLRSGNAQSPPLLGARILSARVFWQRSVAEPPAEIFVQRLQGQTICEIRRRGKFLVCELEGLTLLVHLRMSGDLWMEPSSQPVAAHCRVALSLDSGYRLTFHDPRKFGRMWLLEDPERVLGELGPEPFDPGLTSEAFFEKLSSVRRRLKSLLLDQRFLAGLGNIYTDEALHCAGLHPLTLSAQVSPSQAERLLACIRAVLAEGIRRSGASIDWVYRGGDFQNYFRVYRRTGLPCPTCGAPIRRILLGQRGTHFCPQCQVLPS
ncbi:MAG: bifunctional DNA-formamidopyrimidine glycosylase/DNA-(apurinic or apyrimidinic site) lyase [Anaerolineales bacterium]|nr:bifunctional DNA-formamidopyrimidine glycosylase/DNA-(apurinic or apyrimidinic site) lyase [Anaerolineales bacterium]MCS7247907.1 bifunctional DNA-formamidopyrimidine glycosylase/DNA-(apurinic or apyrimidinic site) lyase [Anaerolineales bacterium]MDW8161717.1 bifunctional DNA-formamidopyrimidine glycosylase/DNA-(apurinic or apyrimidinic site) lyase [Anaerolineales bacterium]MDW8447211.1 bifunctional DNA-formamidopyrimidine glycosylase/DNA-(apurinic or apyrimidinic site) lyase [Anaerolineales 